MVRDPESTYLGTDRRLPHSMMSLQVNATCPECRLTLYLLWLVPAPEYRMIRGPESTCPGTDRRLPHHDDGCTNGCLLSREQKLNHLSYKQVRSSLIPSPAQKALAKSNLYHSWRLTCIRPKMKIKKRDPQDLRMNRLWLGEYFQHHMDERGGLTPKYWSMSDPPHARADDDSLARPVEGLFHHSGQNRPAPWTRFLTGSAPPKTRFF